MTGFQGFDPEALALLPDLPGLDRDGYAARRDLVVEGLTRPGLALVTEVAVRLGRDLTVSPRGSVSPLHRDLRFAAAGAPRYKDHLLLTTWEGPEKRTAPTLWIRVDGRSAGFASGMSLAPPARDRWRRAVAGGGGGELAHVLDGLVGDRGAEVAGDLLARVPRPHDADHPRADLLRRTGFQVRFADPLPDVVDRPELVDWCLDRLGALLPVHRWLVEEVA